MLVLSLVPELTFVVDLSLMSRGRRPRALSASVELGHESHSTPRPLDGRLLLVLPQHPDEHRSSSVYRHGASPATRQGRRVLATTLERGFDLVEVLAAVVGAYGVERAVGGAR